MANADVRVLAGENDLVYPMPAQSRVETSAVERAVGALRGQELTPVRTRL